VAKCRILEATEALAAVPEKSIVRHAQKRILEE
jgi:hypothetical protein